jgi:hypothetical protein
MDAVIVIPALILAAIGYGIGFFSCVLLVMGREIEGEASRHEPACAVIEALSAQVRRYRLAVVVVFVLMLLAMLMLAGAVCYE